MTSLSDIVTYSFSELADGTYKAKDTDFVEETHIRQMTSPILTLKELLPLKQKSPHNPQRNEKYAQLLNSSNTIQEADLPVKLLKDNKDFFAA